MTRNDLITRSELETALFGSFNSVFDSIFDEDFRSFLAPKSSNSYPRVNISDLDKEILMEATVPGLTKDNVKVEYNDGVLTLSGSSTNKSEQKDGNKIIRQEIHKSSFARSFNINDREFDVEKIDAKVENGMLLITIPKLNSVLPTKKTILIN